MLERLAQELFDFTDHRAAQKRRFKGELFPDVAEAATQKAFAQFFQTDRDGNAKGIVVIDPTTEVWQ